MITKTLLDGIITAAYTPIKNDLIDLKSFERLITLQKKGKINGLVLAGTTGEGKYLLPEEKNELISTTAGIVSRETKIIVGIETSSIKETVEHINRINLLNIDSLMLSIPKFFGNNNDKITNYFLSIAGLIDFPIMLYLNPSRHNIDLDDELISRLTQIKQIVALKDAGTDYKRPFRIIPRINKDFSLLAGNDNLFFPFVENGANGIVSVLSNILPKTYIKLYENMLDNNKEIVINLQQKLNKIYDKIFARSNPLGIKYLANCLVLSFCIHYDG